jgi:DNA-binding MarR family transcriptional regulator
MKRFYFDLVMLFERLHRLFLEVIRLELDRHAVRDLSNIQAIILYNIGKDHLTVGEIGNRGYYLGSNVSYNLRKMGEAGYIQQQPSTSDRRSMYVSLTKKGVDVFDKIQDALKKHMESLPYNNLREKDLEQLLIHGRKLEGFWGHLLLHERH